MVRVQAQGTPRTAGGKLRSPSLGAVAIERPRLIATLDASLEAGESIAMLNAPAGFGKTYLLAQWAQQLTDREILTAWCTLTVDDREPQVLWTSLVDALIQASEAMGLELASELGELVPEMGPREHSEFLAGLYSVISLYPDRIVLIVDNSDVLEHSDSEQEFIRSIQGMPDNVHFAFATRSTLQTQTARVSGRLVELTADSLSFSRTETAELLAVRGFAGTDIEQLYLQAEGWPAALSLAMIGISQLEETPSIVDDWEDRSALYDYLRIEVFEHLTQSERTVLLTMGVESLSTPDLVEALGGGDDSAPILRRLASNNRLLYRVSVDANGKTWYRVRRPFGTFLREQLREAQPGRIAQMTASAAEWHAEHGNAFAALRLAVDPPNWKLVDSVLRRRGYEIMADGHSIELLGLMPASTSEALRGPFARLMMGYAAACGAKPDRAVEFLGAAHIDDLNVDDLLEWDWLHYLVQLQLALVQGTPIDLLSSGWKESSLDTVPAPLRLAIRLTRGLAGARTGHSKQATEDLRIALASAENDDELSLMLLSTVGLAGTALADCDLRRAIALCDRALTIATRATTQNQHATMALAHEVAALASMELLETTEARTHAERAVAFASGQEDDQISLQARHVYNDTHFELLPQKRRVAQEFVTAWPPPYLQGVATTSIVASLHSGLHMAAYLDEPRWSERLLDRARQLIGEGYDWHTAYALHLLKTKRGDASRSIVAPLIDDQSSHRVRISEIIASSIDAVLKSRASNQFQAHAAIYRALQIADETGAYLEVSRSDPPTVARILAAGVGRFGPHEHIVRLLLAGDTGESVLSSGSLTTRERQILSELRTLRTVDEIAHDMLLSVNTVKTHMRGIYRKLDVTSRRQAVVKAERFGLI